MSHPLAQKVQAKLRQLIDEKDVVGVQVCVLQDSKTLVDVAAGVMGVFDPRPVETDSLFPVFSCSKAIAATLLNRLVDKGLVKHEDLVIKYWPDFASRISDVEGRKRKELITVAHVLSHRSGLHGAGNELLGSDPFAIADWDRMLTVMEDAIPSVEPGSETVYHSLSFGWLVGGLAEKVSGRKFSDMLDEMFKAMEITGQGYIGIPIGVETRLAAVYFEVQELFTFMEKRRDAATPSNSEATVGGDSSKPSEFETQVSKNFAALDINPLASNPSFFNQLKIRRAVIPAASGNFSARGLAGFYSHLLSGFHGSTDGYVSRATMTAMTVPQNACSIMTFGLGYRLYSFGDGHNGEDAIGGHTGFGHAGLGGSLALCDIERKVSIAIVVNKLSLFRPRATQELVGLIAKELGLGSLAQMAGSSVDMNPLASSSSEGH